MFYGIDLHSDSFKAAVIGDSGDEVKIIQVSLNPETLEKFKAKLTKEDYVAVEASTNTFWFTDQLDPLVKNCFILDPYKFSIIGNSNKKTDKIDAIKIAKKLKYHVLYDQSRDEFPTITKPPKEIRDLRSLFTSYEFIKKERNMTKNRIHALLRQNGLVQFKKKDLSLQHVRTDLLKLATDKSIQIQLELFIRQLEELESKKNDLHDEIIRQGKIFEKEIRLLTSIRGISPFLAVAIMSDIVDIKRFPNAKHLCSYLRAAPSIDASGDKSKVGKVNKHSRTLTLSLMTESVKHFVDSSEEMTRFYFNKRKGKSAGKVRVAVMRKIITVIYHMLTREELYYYVDEKNHMNKIKEFEKVLKKTA